MRARAMKEEGELEWWVKRIHEEYVYEGGARRKGGGGRGGKGGQEEEDEEGEWMLMVARRKGKRESKGAKLSKYRNGTKMKIQVTRWRNM